MIQQFDLRTSQITKVPGSEGLWWPTVSSDGRFICAETAKGALRLVLFDFETQKWVEKREVNSSGWVGSYWGEWSPKGDAYYLLESGPGGERTISRARANDFKFEKVASFPDLRLADFTMALSPDDSPLLLRDLGTQDIYALDWEAP